MLALLSPGSVVTVSFSAQASLNCYKAWENTPSDETRGKKRGKKHQLQQHLSQGCHSSRKSSSETLKMSTRRQCKVYLPLVCRWVERKEWAQALFIAVKEAGPFKVPTVSASKNCAHNLQAAVCRQVLEQVLRQHSGCLHLKLSM